MRIQPRCCSYRYLLSGVFTCGLCGAVLGGRADAGKPRYQCISDPGRVGCGKVAVMAHLAEPVARDKILTALHESPGMLHALMVKRHDLSAGTDGQDPAARLRAITSAAPR
jgi:hypothetical protein